MTLIEYVYKHHVRPRIFEFSKDDAEKAHKWGIDQLIRLERSKTLELLARRFLTYHHPMLATRQFGVNFPNPLGLAAGFDKYCQVYAKGIPAMGWGFAEIGGITPIQQVGNSSVRMLRSEQLESIWNFMGFNNPGVEHARTTMNNNGKSSIPIGLNIGKGKNTPLEKAADDYALVIRRLLPSVQFITLNVSSPNTRDLRQLQTRELFERIVRKSIYANHIQAEIEGVLPPAIGAKVSPDETDEVLADIADIAQRYLDFLILTNSTVLRIGARSWNVPADRGAFSGKLLKDRSRSVLKQMVKRFPKNHKVRLISVGGINSFDEFYERILIGASLCQVYSAWPFEGPDLCKRWLTELVSRLQADNFESVNRAIGARQ